MSAKNSLFFAHTKVILILAVSLATEKMRLITV